ncbi:MAG: LacI family DNA-binding transcriptional regulator, partial [Acutalibacter sp.]
MAATIKDIARETGLSLATISKYLNGGNLREKNRAAIEAAIKKLDYHVNEYARGLKSKKSRTVGVVLPEISNLFNMKIVAVFERVLQENGYSVIVTDCQNNLEQEASSVDFLLKKQVDGIINVPIGSSSRHLRPAVEKKVPILLLDRPLEDLNGVASCVLIDNRGAARLGVRRLLQAGHRRIGVLV